MKQKNKNVEQYEVKQPVQLLPFLIEKMSNRSRNTVKSILARGQVNVNDREITQHNFQLQPNDTVSILKNKVAKAASFDGMKLLYEDDAVIVVEKDAGLLSMASPKERSRTAYKQLMAYVRKVNPNNRIFIVHRLDRDTSGVMMFAKNEKVKQKLQQAWKDMVAERTYVALVEGVVKKSEGTITSWLKESKTFKMYSSPKPNDGQRAVTHYNVMQSNNQFSLLQVHLETGRKKQIRVHMTDIGHPIVGDKKYGSKVNTIRRLGLHASVLAFYHPITGKLLRFESDIPPLFKKKSK
ncbi:RluA family pseudouridine synthase [Aquibacillus sediminis]|uniref:RluA family pseudouridine synthase n=1 Tax=Aquibacillus sediminis TaxID=2574734 RepID=UPI001FEB9631|nr:RluA family pseudouridine synthase [Aquibacillus sediminis]